MKFKSTFVLVSALSLTVPALSSFAQSAPAPQAQSQTQAKKQKMVKFTLKNPTSKPVELKSGEEAITLQPGQSREMKVASGTRITAVSATDSTQSGDVVTEVSDHMSGTTVNLR